MVFPIGTPSISKYSGNSFLFCSRSLCRSMYVHIVFIKFLCGLQHFVPFICLKPDTKRCKPHGTPSTWPLEDQEFYMSFSLRIFTRSLRGLYEICTRSGFCKARQQGKAAGIFSILPFSALGLSNHFYWLLLFNSILFSTLLYIVSSLLFSSTVLSSVRVKLMRSHPHEFLSQKEYVSKHVCPCKVLEKSMTHTIDSSSKDDMYIMDFPTAHRLRHKKMTAA